MEFTSAREVFEGYLPARLAEEKTLARDIAAKYEFRVVGESVWTLDFTGEVGKVSESEAGDADCFITIDSDQVGAVMNNPLMGLKLLMTGQLKIGGQYSLAEHLIRVFGLANQE